MKTVLLLSDKSSGSTIFQDELLKHSAVEAVRYTQHNDHETLFWVKAACLLGQPAVDFAEGRPLYRVFEARRDLQDLLRQNVPDFALPNADHALVFQGWEALCEAHGPVFFEKSPHHLNNWSALALLLRYVQETDHEVYVIGLARNPFAVLYSAWTRWLTPPEERQHFWLRTYRNLLAARALVRPERFHLVRYEDLIEEPTAVMQAVCEFLGLPYETGVGESVHARSAQKWVDDSSFAFQLDPAVAAVAREFGYDDEALFNPEKSPMPEAERRRLVWTRRYRNAKGKLKNRIVRPILERR